MLKESFKQALTQEVHREYEAQMAVLQREFAANPGSRKSVRVRAALMDRLLTHIRREGIKHLPKKPKMAVLAVGGYGRSELFFHSDIDLMFLIKPGQQEANAPLIDLILYILWDLKLKVGHSVRSIDEAIEEGLSDLNTRTSLMEARRVTGSHKLASEFFYRFEAEVVAGKEAEFIEAKLCERADRHQKFGDSRALLEPNIKNGKGGLRDLQTLMWLMRACYGVQKMAELVHLRKISEAELRDFRRARKFLHLVRQHLHDVSERPEEKLTFEAQRVIAERLGYRKATHNANQSVERFMKRYFQVTRTISQLTRTLCFLLDEEWGDAKERNSMSARWKQLQLPQGLVIEGNRLHYGDATVIQQKPELIIGIFWYLQRLEIDIHPKAWQLLTRNLRLIDKALRANEQANEYFLQILLDATNPLLTLKRMNECGVLGKFIPDFGRLAGQMQFDLYHTFTVDEHILTAIGYLHRLEAAEMQETVPMAAGLFPQIQMRRVVYLALLCHDIAKGRGGNHHLKGVSIGMNLARRFGFDIAEQSALKWLIRHHQHMSMVAFKRDLDDPQTIEDFAILVASPQRLMMLYVLTVADIHAVAPNIWNSWKGALLETLYRKTERALEGGQLTIDLPVRESLQVSLEKMLVQVNPRDITAYIAGADAVSLEAYEVETHARIFPCWQAVTQGDEFGIRFKSHPQHANTNVTIATNDRHGLFSQMAGVLAICGANIRDARIYTRQDDIVIDRFAIQDENGNVFDEDRRQDRIRARLKQVLDGELDLPQAIEEAEARYPDTRDIFDMETQISFDNQQSDGYTLIEVQCLDRRGLLYRVTHALSVAGLTISSAHIATYGEKAVDVFYVRDKENRKLQRAAEQDAIRQKLLNELA